MRYFNTYGPVNAQEHYVVPRQKLVDELITQIERGSYFTIFAPRQMGKTTLLRQLSAYLSETETYLPIALSVEAYESWSVPDFLQAFSQQIGQTVLTALRFKRFQKQEQIQLFLKSQNPRDLPAFQQFLYKLYHYLSGFRFVLIVRVVAV